MEWTIEAAYGTGCFYNKGISSDSKYAKKKSYKQAIAARPLLSDQQYICDVLTK